MLFEAVALVYRAPAMLYLDLNWDEPLYRLIGNSLASGHAPYTEFWDRKPVGIFLIMAAIKLTLGGSVLALRNVTSMFVGLSAFLLALNAREIFPSLPRVGTMAGFFYIFYSVKNGGAGANTELFYVPADLAGFLLVFRAAKNIGTDVLVPAFVAGFLMGVALQIKQTAIFDILAYAMIYLLTRVENFGRAGLPHQGRLVIATAVGLLMPTILIVLWYILIGKLDTYIDANFQANIGLIGSEAPAFNTENLIVGLRGFDTLFLGAAVMLMVGAILAKSGESRRGFLAICCWLAAMTLSLLFSRRFADHFFLQVIPSISLATAFGAVLILQATVPARLMPMGVAICVALIGVRAGASQFNAAAEVLWRRHVEGVAHWGDRTATISAAMATRLRRPDDVYVFSRLLGIYDACGATPPTRFPFSLHLFSEYAPVDGEKEFKRILDNAPRFIVVDDNWLNQMANPGPDVPNVFSMLHQTLSRNYVLDGHAGLFRSWGGGNVEGSVGATVFRLIGTPEYRSTQPLQYDPGPQVARAEPTG